MSPQETREGIAEAIGTFNVGVGGGRRSCFVTRQPDCSGPSTRLNSHCDCSDLWAYLWSACSIQR